MTNLSIAQYRALLLEFGLGNYPPSIGIQFLLEEREKQLWRLRDAELQVQRIDQTIEKLKMAG